MLDTDFSSSGSTLRSWRLHSGFSQMSLDLLVLLTYNRFHFIIAIRLHIDCTYTLSLFWSSPHPPSHNPPSKMMINNFTDGNRRLNPSMPERCFLLLALSDLFLHYCYSFLVYIDLWLATIVLTHGTETETAFERRVRSRWYCIMLD
jgi:hypothetical protein